MATDTFDIDPGFEFVRESNRPAAMSDAAKFGVVLTRQINERGLLLFTLNWPDVPSQVLVRIRQLMARYASVGRMNFTPPGESTIEVRFKSNTLTDTQKSASNASLTLQLEQVR